MEHVIAVAEHALVEGMTRVDNQVIMGERWLSQARRTNEGRVLLWVMWIGALVGVVFTVLWVGAPRWLYTPVYVALGWVAIFFLPGFLTGAGVAALVLIVVGGALYSVGALIYGLKRPNPSPSWFGFHEVFHALTVAALIVHYVGVSLTVYT